MSTELDGEERGCAYCPEPGADVCVSVIEAASGPGRALYAHRACAEARRVPVLYALTPPVGRAS